MQAPVLPGGPQTRAGASDRAKDLHPAHSPRPTPARSSPPSVDVYKRQSPNRPLIAIGGIAAGMFLGIGFIVLTELLNRAVRRPKDIVKAFGITPLVTIPYMRTPNETMRRRSVFVGMLLAAVAGIPAMIYAVHVFYQPLDILLNRVAAQFGIHL